MDFVVRPSAVQSFEPSNMLEEVSTTRRRPNETSGNVAGNHEVNGLHDKVEAPSISDKVHALVQLVDFEAHPDDTTTVWKQFYAQLETETFVVQRQVLETLLERLPATYPLDDHVLPPRMHVTWCHTLVDAVSQTAPSPQLWNVSCRQLRYMVYDQSLVVLREQENTLERERYVQWLLSLPSVLYQVCYHEKDLSLPLWATETAFWTKLSHHALERQDNWLLDRLARRSRGVYVAHALLERDSPQELSLSPRSASHVALALLRQLQRPDESTNKTVDDWLSCVRNSLINDGIVRDFFLQDAMKATDLPVHWLAPMLALPALAAFWGRASYVRGTPAAKQQHATGLLLFLLERQTVDPSTTATTEEAWMWTLTQGVSERLHVTTSSIRLDGMRVARFLAKRLGQEVSFEELDVYDQQQIAQTNTASKDGGSASPKGEQESTGEYPSEPPNIYDDDSVWDDESQYLAYDLHDDEEDLRTVPRPRYLLDCLSLLRRDATEEHALESHEVALEELPKLLARRPMDLPDVAASLTSQLLHQENKEDISNFDDQVMESLVELTVAQPMIVGETLVGDLFTDDEAFYVRVKALSTLSHAAYKIAGYHQKVNSITKEDSRRQLEQTSLVDEQSSAPTTVAVTSNNDTSKTRRFRSPRTPQAHSSTNKFHQIAPVWFYALLSGFMEHKNKESMWGHHVGAQLLSRLLETLTSIVDSSGLGPASPVLAQDLFALAWPFRGAQVSDVRLAVLMAATVAFERMSIESLSLLLVEEDEPVIPLLVEMGKSDPDGACQRIAAESFALLRDRVLNSGEGPSLLND